MSLDIEKIVDEVVAVVKEAETNGQSMSANFKVRYAARLAAQKTLEARGDDFEIDASETDPAVVERRLNDGSHGSAQAFITGDPAPLRARNSMEDVK